jgi:hypothetical protein
MTSPIMYSIVDNSQWRCVVVIDGVVKSASAGMKDWQGKYWSELYRFAKANGMTVEEIR